MVRENSMDCIEPKFETTKLDIILGTITMGGYTRGLLITYFNNRREYIRCLTLEIKSAAKREWK